MITTNSRQVGGTNYEDIGSIEPVHVMVEYKLNWFQGEVLKYVSRRKNGAIDLDKAVHICEMANVLKVTNPTSIDKLSRKPHLLVKYQHQFTSRFKDHSEGSVFYSTLLSIIQSDWNDVIMLIKHLKPILYDREGQQNP